MNVVELDAIRAERAARQQARQADPPAPAGYATQADLQHVIDELGGAVRGLRPDIQQVTQDVRRDLAKLRRDLTIRFGAMLAVMTAVILLGIRYLPPGP